LAYRSIAVWCEGRNIRFLNDLRSLVVTDSPTLKRQIATILRMRARARGGAAMNKMPFATTLAIMLAADAAAAADYARPYTVSAPLSAYSWAGPYLGANLGYQWGATTNNPTKPRGITGGAQAGYNWQTGQFVFGAEADLQLSAADDM